MELIMKKKLKKNIDFIYNSSFEISTRRLTLMSTKKITDKGKRKKSVPKALRMKVWETYIGNSLNGNCYVCNRPLKIDSFEAGHIIAECNGGQPILENLRVVCKPCNNSCYTTNLEDFKNQFRQEPLKTNEDNIKIQTNDKYIFVKNNSCLDHLIKFNGQDVIFDDICKQISADNVLFEKFIELHKKANGNKLYVGKNNNNNEIKINLELRWR